MKPVDRLAKSDPPDLLLSELAAAIERGAPEIGTDRATARREAALAAAAVLSGDEAGLRLHAANLLARDPVGDAARADGLSDWARRLVEVESG